MITWSPRPGHDLDIRIVPVPGLRADDMNLNDKRFPEVVTIHEFHKINQFHQKRVIFLHFFFGISGEPVERADIVRFERERHITVTTGT